ncbi:MAG TPA: hypothetical protein VJV79_21380, partial [Polyangiaceae bacterium]|nr:hypothetical protein [Polyangiaceae bacterium]
MRSILRGLWILGGVSVAAAVAAGCGSDCNNTGTCGPYIPPDGGGGTTGDHGGSAGLSGTGGLNGSSSGASGASGAGVGGMDDAGAGAGAGGGGDREPCDSSKSPSEESCVVDNEYAIFVAPTGHDDASGTKAGPVQTIAKALELAGDTKIVIACDGTYDEQVNLTSGAKLYGGFACPGKTIPWRYEPGKKALVAPSARGIALSISSGASDVVIEDFEFDAKDGVDPGESSVAAFVNASTRVLLSRVKLVAGKGVDGADGTLTKVTFPMQSELNGRAASGDTGGAFNLVTCPAGGTTTGAAGGNGGSGVTGGGLGMPDLGSGKGGVVGADCSVGLGTTGASASPKPAASGATKVGSITAAGWTGASGVDGASGTPGQGGGGGAGAVSGGGGGGGGAGGCGGAGATGGKAGGSSIALLVLNSPLTLTSSELIAADAGKGGSGVAGQDGQAGGSAGVQVPDGCGGGKGGKG